MLSENQLKIIVESNRPSDLALRHFQKKLFQLQRANEANQAVKSHVIAKGENQQSSSDTFDLNESARNNIDNQK